MSFRKGGFDIKYVKSDMSDSLFFQNSWLDLDQLILNCESYEVLISAMFSSNREHS